MGFKQLVKPWLAKGSDNSEEVYKGQIGRKIKCKEGRQCSDKASKCKRWRWTLGAEVGGLIRRTVMGNKGRWEKRYGDKNITILTTLEAIIYSRYDDGKQACE